jgi:hypothetical protein
VVLVEAIRVDPGGAESLQDTREAVSMLQTRAARHMHAAESVGGLFDAACCSSKLRCLDTWLPSVPADAGE